MWYLFCCLVNIWSKLFFVLKYVVWYFYVWYTELVCLFEYWVCVLCLLYFTELVVDIVDFVFLLYWWFLYAWVSCALLLGNAEGEYWKCILEFFFWTYLLFTIFLLCTSLLYEFYFVLLTESVCLCCLTEFCICIFALCALYSSCAFDIEKFKLDICYCVDWDYTPICATELQKGGTILFVPLSRRVILFCDIFVTKFPFPLFRRRICRSKVILGILKNGVLGGFVEILYSLKVGLFCFVTSLYFELGNFSVSFGFDFYLFCN